MKVLLAPKNPQLFEVEYPFINGSKPFGEVRVVVDSALLVQEIKVDLRIGVVSEKSNEAEFLSPELGGSAWPRWFRSGDVSRLTVEHAQGRDPDVEGGLPARSGRLTTIEVEHAT